MKDIVPLKAFKDNYIWTLRTATHAAVVDREASPCSTISRPRV
jgi:hypothetical protein